jgi:hypothetical protein
MYLLSLKHICSICICEVSSAVKLSAMKDRETYEEKENRRTRRGSMDIHISKLCRHLPSDYDFVVEAIRSTRNAMPVNSPEDGRLVL